MSKIPLRSPDGMQSEEQFVGRNLWTTSDREEREMGSNRSKTARHML